MLQVTDLTTAYQGLVAISGITIAVGRGEIVCIAGANGAGKSTLLKSIAGLERPRAGTIVFDRAPIHGLAPHFITARGIAFVPEDRHANGDTKTRKDIKIDEGQVLQEKHDFKGDVIGGALGTGGGALVGAIFSNVVRGFGFGLAGSAVYIAVRKGKEVDLPAQTGMLARIDSTVTMPMLVGSNNDSPKSAPAVAATVSTATDSGN